MCCSRALSSDGATSSPPSPSARWPSATGWLTSLGGDLGARAGRGFSRRAARRVSRAALSVGGASNSDVPSVGRRCLVRVATADVRVPCAGLCCVRVRLVGPFCGHLRGNGTDGARTARRRAPLAANLVPRCARRASPTRRRQFHGADVCCSLGPTPPAWMRSRRANIPSPQPCLVRPLETAQAQPRIRG